MRASGVDLGIEGIDGAAFHDIAEEEFGAGLIDIGGEEVNGGGGGEAEEGEEDNFPAVPVEGEEEIADLDTGGIGWGFGNLHRVEGGRWLVEVGVEERTGEAIEGERKTGEEGIVEAAGRVARGDPVHGGEMKCGVGDFFFGSAPGFFEAAEAFIVEGSSAEVEGVGVEMLEVMDGGGEDEVIGVEMLEGEIGGAEFIDGVVVVEEKDGSGGGCVVVAGDDDPSEARLKDFMINLEEEVEWLWWDAVAASGFFVELIELEESGFGLGDFYLERIFLGFTDGSAGGGGEVGGDGWGIGLEIELMGIELDGGGEGRRERGAAEFEGVPVALVGEILERGEEAMEGGIGEEEWGGEIGEGEADGASWGEEAGDFEEGKEGEGLVILVEVKVEGKVVIGFGEDACPSGGVEERGLGMKGDERVPFWVEKGINGFEFGRGWRVGGRHVAGVGDALGLSGGGLVEEVFDGLGDGVDLFLGEFWVEGEGDELAGGFFGDGERSLGVT